MFDAHRPGEKSCINGLVVSMKAVGVTCAHLNKLTLSAISPILHTFRA